MFDYVHTTFAFIDFCSMSHIEHYIALFMTKLFTFKVVSIIFQTLIAQSEKRYHLLLIIFSRYCHCVRCRFFLQDCHLSSMSFH